MEKHRHKLFFLSRVRRIPAPDPAGTQTGFSFRQDLDPAKDKARHEMTDNYRIRTMTRKDLDIAVAWAAEEGWNPGLDDADPFFACDPEGYLIGELNDRPISTISAVRYGEDFGFLGFYIVHPDFRGRGYGLQIWQAAMDRLDSRNIGLDGVVAQQDNYRKSGFALAYRNQRFEGVGGGDPPAGLVELSSRPAAEVIAYDAAVFTLPRPTFLSGWINQPRGIALGVIAQGKLRAYGLIRACRRGFKIGPLFADTPDTAERLFQGLLSQAPGQPVFLDVPQPNPEAIALARRHAMSPVFETARMYTRSEPDAPLHKVYGVTTFELG